MAPKSKANGAGALAKSEKATPSASGTSTPIPDAAASSSGGLGKPDKAAYDAEQDQLRKKIDEIQAKLVRAACLCSGVLSTTDVYLNLHRLLSRRRSLAVAAMMLLLPAKKS
jgi:hypothetical protein